MKRHAAREPVRVELTLNGTRRSALAEPRMLLSDFLRHALGATGVHVGCEHGVCGACTVAIDGEPARACLAFAVQCADRRIDTVEGLARDGQLTDLQLAFRRHHALQCGYCTSGILISAKAFLARVPRPAERAVREMLSGHLCRCTGYGGMVAAILEVAEARTRQSTNPPRERMSDA